MVNILTDTPLFVLLKMHVPLTIYAIIWTTTSTLNTQSSLQSVQPIIYSKSWYSFLTAYPLFKLLQLLIDLGMVGEGLGHNCWRNLKLVDTTVDWFIVRQYSCFH